MISTAQSCLCCTHSLQVFESLRQRSRVDRPGYIRVGSFGGRHRSHDFRLLNPLRGRHREASRGTGTKSIELQYRPGRLNATEWPVAQCQRSSRDSGDGRLHSDANDPLCMNGTRPAVSSFQHLTAEMKRRGTWSETLPNASRARSLMIGHVVRFRRPRAGLAMMKSSSSFIYSSRFLRHRSPSLKPSSFVSAHFLLHHTSSA